MSVYTNWRYEDTKQAEAEAAELFDRHERAWHAMALERMNCDCDAEIDAILTHEYLCERWHLSLMGAAAYERWCKWNWQEELGQLR